MKDKIIILLTMLLVAVSVPKYSYAIFNKIQSPDYYEAGTRQAFRSQKWNEGKKLLDEAWQDYGTMSVMNELMGWYYYHYKKYDRARFYLVKSLRDDNTNTHARELLSKVEEETHNYSSAICYINELLESNPYARGLWRRKIDLYRRQGNEIEANRLLQRLQQIYPNDEVVRKDIAYVNEIQLSKQKKAGDINGQVESLQNIVKAYPTNVDYCLQLANMYLQTGNTSGALEVLGNGVRNTHSPVLMKKRAAILGDQGRYVEAINYLKECQRAYHTGAVTSLINEMEKSAADAARYNDPYTATAQVYSKQHSGEALKFLLNTAIARGYYNDALMYLNDAKKGGETEDVLYKEYIIQRRLGNKTAAAGALTKILAKNPKNSEARTELALLRYENGTQAMNYGQFQEAIPELAYAVENTDDEELRKSGNVRLFNCYFNTKRYEEADTLLERMRDTYENYTTQKASLLNEQGHADLALMLLDMQYEKETDPQKQKLIAYQYEEFAIPYIKGLMQRGMTRQANKAAQQAILICPKSNNLLHQALSTSGQLGNQKQYADIVKTGRQLYPDDPFFIVKEAQLMSQDGNSEGALDLIRPYMDTYVGDSTLVNAYAENSLILATDQMKSQAYKTALATVDSALVYKHNDNELLYTKGLIFEKMHQYDSAYVYQQHYKPSIMEYQEHSRHLEELRNQNMKNEISVMYQTARPSDEDVKTSNASIYYTRKEKNDEYTGYINYAGRDGASSDSKTSKDMETGGTGIQIGAQWKHSFRGTPWSVTGELAWANKYFPQITFKAQVDYELPKQWVVGAHVSYRRIHAYSAINDSVTSNGIKVWERTGWQHNYGNLFGIGLNGQKSLDKWVLTASLDAFILNNKVNKLNMAAFSDPKQEKYVQVNKTQVFFNGQVKAQFFPIDVSRSHIYAVAGLGNAPQTELLDNAMEAGFDKLNTFVGAGIHWFFNKHIGAALNGTWYTLYRSQQTQTGIYGTTPTTINKTDYKNMFYLQGVVTVAF